MGGGKLEINLCTGGRGYIEGDGTVHCKVLPFLSVAQCLEGTYEIGLDGGEPVALEEGGAFITRPDQAQRIVHRCPNSGGNMTAQWLFFAAVYDGFLDIGRCLQPPVILTPREAGPFGEVIRLLVENQKAAPPAGASPLGWELRREARRQELAFRALELLLEVSEVMFPEESYQAILPAIALMDRAEGSERLRLEGLAHACNLSVTGFTGLFRRLTGDSPMSFYQKRRLSRAAAVLLTSQASLGEIAQSCGFYDQFHLSREFKRRYGVSPRQYRQDFEGQTRPHGHT